jgi:putative nucleotidyltransferase with HDIG domain
MPTPPRSRSRTAELTQLELTQRKRTLAIVLWIVIGAAVALGFVNLSIRAIPETLVLFAAAVVCLPALLLNARGRYLLASGIATLVILAAIVFNMIQGHGTHDSAVVAVPLFVMFGPLLYGRRAVPVFLGLGLASVAVVASLEMNGVIQTAMPASFADLASLSVLVTCAGILVWVIMSNLEGNLERARRSEADLRVAYDHTLEGWARALEQRDEGTVGHARRVVNLSVRLAKEWGIGDEELQHIRRGALLHDIGKMALPDDVLLKPGPLNPREKAIMKRHTTIAGSMLGGISYLREALSIPLAHHEHWDGTGYPKGLKGRRIPLQARLFSVVDHYDALSSPRPYRKAWPKRRVIAYLRENSGKIFDPDVVDAFLRLHEQGAFGKDT